MQTVPRLFLAVGGTFLQTAQGKKGSAYALRSAFTPGCVVLVPTQLTSRRVMSEPSSAPQQPPTPHQAGGSGLQLPATLKERCEINKQLSRAAEDACIASERVWGCQ